MKLLRFFQLRKALAVQVNDGFQEGNLFFKLFDAALRREGIEKRLLAFDQEVQLFMTLLSMMTRVFAADCLSMSSLAWSIMDWIFSISFSSSMGKPPCI